MFCIEATTNQLMFGYLDFSIITYILVRTKTVDATNLNSNMINFYINLIYSQPKEL